MFFKHLKRDLVTKANIKPSYDLNHLEVYWPKALNWYEKYFSRFTTKTYKTVSPFLNFPEASKVLEIGAGIGLGAEVVRPKLQASAKLILTNHVECLVESLRKKNFFNTEVLKVNPSALPFPGESFDRILAMNVIEEFPNAADFIRETYRVLEPGGIMAASVTGKKDSHTLAMIFNKIKSVYKINNLVNFKQNLGNVGAVKKIFKDAGFINTYAFYEGVQYNSLDVAEVKNVFLEEPFIKEAGNYDLIEKSIEEELKNLFFKEEIPLSAEFLIIIAQK